MTNSAAAKHLPAIHSPAGHSPTNQAIRCGFYGAGIVGTLVVYGLMQERMMTVPFGGEVFTVSNFLVFCNRFANLLYAAFMGMAMREPLQLQAPCWKYMLISFSNVAATCFQYESLKYVSFPVLMLGKSFKMMPVMAWSTVISSQKYSALDWIVAALVTCGVSIFCLAGPISTSPWDSASTIKGMLLVLAFLVCDGLTATMQEKMFREEGTSKFNQMFYVNLFSFFHLPGHSPGLQQFDGRLCVRRAPCRLRWAGRASQHGICRKSVLHLFAGDGVWSCRIRCND